MLRTVDSAGPRTRWLDRATATALIGFGVRSAVEQEGARAVRRRRSDRSGTLDLVAPPQR